MSDPIALLNALQVADSTLPIGRFVHSHGLEAWLAAHPDAPAEQLAELVEAVVCESVAPLDATFTAHAHRASTPARLLALDDRLTARKLAPAARAASQAPGRQLAALAPQLVAAARAGTLTHDPRRPAEDALVTYLAHRVRIRETDGNLAIVAGTLARALGVSAQDAVLVELRGAAGALLSAAVRLGALNPTGAQLALAQLGPAFARAAGDACTRTLDHVSATAPELELFALAHVRADARLFTT
ncbi:MAG TPA: urease accessory UreF family protein [Conexibacter sp.]|nr:urease accessory UreF family protein [Conexibacter sp.]